MARAEDKDTPEAAANESFAARLKQKYGEGVDPEVSLERPGAQAQSGASSELLRRLADHGLKQSRYRFEGEVARGGMGAILRVWDEDLRRTLAMKVILGKGESPAEGGTSAADPRTLGRFLEEAQITGQLDHPGIVPVHELGLDSDGRVYFTMKLVKGRDLKQIFNLVFEEQEGWNETRALGVVLKVCEAMAYAHAKGVIHRDLKPANVMVGDFGEVYVMDWGLARVLGRKDAHDIRLKPEFTTSLESVQTERREEREESADSAMVTMDGDVMGTPSYISPEQARGEIEKLSPRSDVYAIGALLYHLLARQVPHVPLGAQVSNRMVLRWVLEGAPKPLNELRQDVPAELVAICEKAMAREPAARYGDTLALAEDLRAYLEHRVGAAYETGAVAELKKWVQRNKALAAASAAAAAILVIGLLVSASLYVKARRETARADVKAREANANALVAQQNEQRALAGEKLAKSEKERADAKADEAERERKVAQQRADDVLSLSAIQDLQDLIGRADVLWPAHPENSAKYEEWLRDAHALIEGRSADEANGIKATPSLADHRRKLVELEARALPQSEEERAKERASHPRFAEQESKQGELEWMSRMLGTIPWPTDAEALAELDASPPPNDAKALNALAWPLVDPDKPVYGGEAKALVLARRAVESATSGERAQARDTLAWALYRNGRFEEALAEDRKALEEVAPDQEQAYEGYLKRLEAGVESWSTAEALAEREKEKEGLAAEIAELEREIGARREWTFAEGEDRWWHVQLTNLIADIEAFGDAETGLCSGGTTAEHGWGIERRAQLARTIEERSVTGAESASLWAQAMASIRDPSQCPLYEGLVIAPQLGLLPIGRDPASGLWEFADLQTGEAATRAADGKLVLTEETGLVFVLIPGGRFAMGAQRTDPDGENYDPQASNDEAPVHQVTLSPYLLSKYELTQGQWERFAGKNPSLIGPDNYFRDWDSAGKGCSSLHPVEQVSWDECMETLFRMGTTLPTEAQWERACRAGTTSVYWSGDEKESLQGVANLSDAYGKSHGNWTWSEWEAGLDDGHTVHAEVGSYRANAFGLHDMHGNVWESCRDGYGGYNQAVKAGDGERLVTDPHFRVHRGGDFRHAAAELRSAERFYGRPEDRYDSIGLRPARGITTP